MKGPWTPATSDSSAPMRAGHGKGTVRSSTRSLKSLALKRTEVPVCALKPYTGHMGAASDICEVILGIRAINDGIVPGTLNFSKAEAAFEDMAISSSVTKTAGNSFLSISYGIIGQSSCILVEGCAR